MKIIFFTILFNWVCIVHAIPINQAQIKAAYLEGEFEKIRTELETYRKTNPNSSQEDKIFMFKYLGVVYATDANTKDKAESYMYQLLKLAPNIELLDMYVSEKINLMFQDVKNEYKRRKQYTQQYDEYGRPKSISTKSSSALSNVTETVPVQSKKQPKKNAAWIGWTLGCLAVATAVTIFLLLSQDRGEKNVGSVDL
ncbi:MAG: hypothetical protein HQK83_07420 [Fibrobacteria bacterium]|nr:hypothetical protein [Fibrobacteria bacterium]